MVIIITIVILNVSSEVTGKAGRKKPVEVVSLCQLSAPCSNWLYGLIMAYPQFQWIIDYWSVFPLTVEWGSSPHFYCTPLHKSKDSKSNNIREYIYMRVCLLTNHLPPLSTKI